MTIQETLNAIESNTIFCKGDSFAKAMDIFRTGISDYFIEDYDDPSVFVEDVKMLFEDPRTMELSDDDTRLIENMYYIAADLQDMYYDLL